MSAAPQLASPGLEARLASLESEVRALVQSNLQQSARLDDAAQLMKGQG